MGKIAEMAKAVVDNSIIAGVERGKLVKIVAIIKPPVGKLREIALTAFSNANESQRGEKKKLSDKAKTLIDNSILVEEEGELVKLIATLKAPLGTLWIMDLIKFTKEMKLPWGS